MFERFTTDARSAVVEAQGHARRRGDRRIGCEHLLLAVSGSTTPVGDVLRGYGITAAAIEATLDLRRHAAPFQDIDEQALAAIGIDLGRVRACVEEALGSRAGDQADPDAAGPRSRFRRRGATRAHVPFDKQAKTCLEESLRHALAAQDRNLGIEYLALALTASTSAVIHQILADAGTTSTALQLAIRQRYRRAG